MRKQLLRQILALYKVTLLVVLSSIFTLKTPSETSEPAFQILHTSHGNVNARISDTPYVSQANSDLPKEKEHADNVDFLSTNETIYTEKLGLIGEILHYHNLLVNADKTKNSVLKRGHRHDESWQKCKKTRLTFGGH